jgi:hypothetical protein
MKRRLILAFSLTEITPAADNTTKPPAEMTIVTPPPAATQP